MKPKIVSAEDYNLGHTTTYFYFVSALTLLTIIEEVYLSTIFLLIALTIMYKYNMRPYKGVKFQFK